MKFISIIDFEQLKSIKAPEQYADGKLRYISNHNYYYYIGTLNGYITFEESNDLLLNEDYAKLFDKRVVFHVSDGVIECSKSHESDIIV
jgi:hypothetical protein